MTLPVQGQPGRIGALSLLTVLGVLLGLAGSSEGGRTAADANLTKSFRHKTHLKLKQGKRRIKCADCHKLDASGGEFPVCKGERMPFPSHETCTRCHDKAFYEKPLAICTNCHANADITAQAPLRTDRLRAGVPRATFNHKLHIDPERRVHKSFKLKPDCISCHVFSKGGAVVEDPGHAQCCTCHTQEHVEPSMNDCAGCHARPAKQKAAVSSIEKFSHASHKQDPSDGASLACQRCHTSVGETIQVKDVTMPVMDTCVTCHDGKLSFHYGKCLNCHGKAVADKPTPASHKAATAKAARKHDDAKVQEDDQDKKKRKKKKRKKKKRKKRKKGG